MSSDTDALVNYFGSEGIIADAANAKVADAIASGQSVVTFGVDSGYTVNAQQTPSAQGSTSDLGDVFKSVSSGVDAAAKGILTLQQQAADIQTARARVDLARIQGNTALDIARLQNSTAGALAQQKAAQQLAAAQAKTQVLQSLAGGGAYSLLMLGLTVVGVYFAWKQLRRK